MAVKILTVLGARPQFIKAAVVSRAIAERDDVFEVIVHTGQHFDSNMSDVFFDQLNIPKPHYNLEISGLSHGAMTGRMLEQIESLIQKEQPDSVLVYGDTNSTLAGALAASKLHVPVVHVEAGLRSRNLAMPEEINRVLTDRMSTLLLCPTETAVENLKQEGFPFPANGHDGAQAVQLIENVGDVMFDAVLHYRNRALAEISLDCFGLQHRGYILCTLHRQENIEDSDRLEQILRALRSLAKDIKVVLPMHPRLTTKLNHQSDTSLLQGVTLLDPLPYLEMQRIEISSKCILTDSGGIQKEAYFHRVPCVTLRNETEWPETVDSGWNTLAGSNYSEIIRSANTSPPANSNKELFGNGRASEKIVSMLLVAADAAETTRNYKGSI